MDIYERRVDDLLNELDKVNISNEEKIKYLKIYTKILIEKKAEIENNFILGTLISSIGLGTMINTNIYISSILFGSGIIISLYKAKKINEKITINDIKEYKRSR